MSQRPIAGPEDLTPHQRAYLRYLRELHDGRRPGARVRAALFRLLVVYAAVVAVCAAFDVPAVAIMFTAMMAGMVARDMAYLRAFDRAWPALRAVLDRKRLDELSADPPHDSYRS